MSDGDGPNGNGANGSSCRLNPSSSGECTSGAVQQSKHTTGGTSNFPSKGDIKQEHSGEGGASGDASVPGTERGSDKDTTTNIEEKRSDSGNWGKQKTKPQRPEVNDPCPRCSSQDTKFCYYNNYDVKQPRFLCKTCQRYWTAGGTLRNVPPGSGRRKSKSLNSKEADTAGTVGPTVKQSNFPLPSTSNFPMLSDPSTTNFPMLTDPMLAYTAAQQQLLNSTALSALKIPPPMQLPGQWPSAMAPDLSGALRSISQQPGLASLGAGLPMGAAATAVDAAGMAVASNTGVNNPATAVSSGLNTQRQGDGGAVDARRVKPKTENAPAAELQSSGIDSTGADPAGGAVATPSGALMGQTDAGMLNQAQMLSENLRQQAVQAAWLQQAAGGWPPGLLGGHGLSMPGGNPLEVMLQQQLQQQQMAASFAAANAQQQNNLQMQAAAQMQAMQAAQMQAATACGNQVNPYLLAAAAHSWPYGNLANPNAAGMMSGAGQNTALMTQQILNRPAAALPSMGMAAGLGPGSAAALGSWQAAAPGMTWPDATAMGMSADANGMNWAGMVNGGLGNAQPTCMQQCASEAGDLGRSMGMSTGNSSILGKHPRAMEGVPH